MNRKEIIDMSDPDCPVRNVLARICDKWSVLVMLVLKDAEVMRFNEIQKSIPDISQKMLTVTLRTLEEDGFVKRKIYAEVPPKRCSRSSAALSAGQKKTWIPSSETAKPASAVTNNLLRKFTKSY